KPLSSRVSFLFSRDPLARRASEDLSNLGVIARADELVTCDQPAAQDLIHRLLGTTLLVADLDTARTIAATIPGQRCITLNGEILEADGTLTVGTHHAESGLISRKSELRDLRHRIADMEADITRKDDELVELRRRIGETDATIEAGQRDADALSEQVNDLRLQ